MTQLTFFGSFHEQNFLQLSNKHFFSLGLMRLMIANIMCQLKKHGEWKAV